MALAGVKFDDGRGGFASNCFPVRSAFGRTSEDANGAWLIAQHAEQRRRFKAVLCSKPRTYSRIKEERKKSELQGTALDSHKFDDEGETDDVDDDGKILDGFFLMKHCCVDDPSDLCSVNIANKELTDVKEDDLNLFENVAYVNAGENYLPFEAFRGFPSLRELEIPLNGLRNLQISHTDFTSLEMLDLSYNNLSQEDLLSLGLLTRLKVLHLTGNSFRNLPQDLAMPYLSREKEVRLQRFGCLEVLLLDDNKFMDMSVFAALAGLPKLRHLNLSKNELFFVPQLKSVEGRVVTQDGVEKKRPKRPGSSRKSARRSKSRNSAEQEASLIDLETDRAKTADEAPNIQVDGTNASVEGTAQKEDKAPEKTGTFSEDPNLQGQQPTLLAEDFSTGDLSSRIADLNSVTGETALEQDPGPKLPPFPELRYLNLADNKICEEDALLAVAAWPMLVELDIYNNPLTQERTGDPPLLKRFLHDRLGIKLNRKKPSEDSGFLKKSKVEIRPTNRKVTETVPKVPKLSLEEKMMLQLPPSQPTKAIEHGSSPIPQEGFDNLHLHSKRSVLPPIATTPKDEYVEAWADKITEEDEDEYQDEDDYDEEEEAERRRSGEETTSSDTFFMTQPEDLGEKASGPTKKELSFADTEKKGPQKSQKAPKDKRKTAKDDRYKGYELLLDIEDLEDEPELPAAKDIQGNISALKHTLNHMLVYRDPAVELSKVKKMVQEYRRAPVPPAKPHQSYQEKVDDVLTKLKTRSTLEEEKLTTVLKDKQKFNRNFPEAEHLLGQIQRRYNAVRVHSLRDAKQARDITENVLDLLPAPPTKAK